ncbi:hypothetical protein PROVRUST_04811 [Providencia rustigianii DSM 4541]|uniref:Uncharacterized protein n=1 Tax=Providencia rustigianii DSM 4541 TaxID=500637 RepID=D1NYJ1_9GAMM|nr:hypothetical protein PROVRUST_04811 [Providencia rustigianii DSM 4541]
MINLSIKNGEEITNFYRLCAVEINNVSNTHKMILSLRNLIGSVIK